MNCQNLWFCWLVFPKNILILPQNFLNFFFDVVEQQSVIILWRYESKGYTSVVLGYSEVSYFGERDVAAFGHLSFVFWLYTLLLYRYSRSSNSLAFHTSSVISSILAGSVVLIFVSTKSNSSWVKCPSLMFNCLLIIFVIGLALTFGDFPSRF